MLPGTLHRFLSTRLGALRRFAAQVLRRARLMPKPSARDELTIHVRLAPVRETLDEGALRPARIPVRGQVGPTRRP